MAIGLSVFFLYCPTPVTAQELKTSSYGVSYIASEKSYKHTLKKDNQKQMVELKTKMPGLVYDLRYATVNNFVKLPLYPVTTTSTFLRLPAANALQQVQQELKQKGLGLKIFDAYRPYSVTIKFWELIKDERYVANPSKGSGHNRGLAVDLTIIDLKTGIELDMGTGFDNFSDTAHHSFTQLSTTVLQNRKVLKEVMLKHGFTALETEWWHYYWPNNRNYEVLDLDFKKLNKFTQKN
ncbi:peptidase M15 [Lacibacter luteus]|uniref:D-alanyl-D-alanine dipeptidase n=1 Tax=Lacibacter luteus TaxID=2508719 RepID=A0A4Q1CFB8_9BACT|nr:M15 family metallopeptidase [Lacibacter luteus]RXK58352.1 peptidase M15 [Lacibacter luteus]